MFLSVDPGATSTIASRIVERLFKGYPGNLAVRLWDGEILRFGHGTPAVQLVFHAPGTLRKLILHGDSLDLAEAYFCGDIDIKGDIYQALRLRDHFQSLTLSAKEKAGLLVSALLLNDSPADDAGSTAIEQKRWLQKWSHKHTKATDRRAIAFHYDISNDFYRLWLDEQMVYSCAYFATPEDTLEQAQRNKLERICRKLQLRPGESLLDIGCGWGALIRWAAHHHGVHAHGITLSREQQAYCQSSIEEAGLQGQVTVEMRDYRDLPAAKHYDKIVSVGMFEHVGLKNLPHYFTTASKLLTRGGLFLNHGITHDREGWRKTDSTRFINRYVFPDGELDRVSNIQRVMERCGYEILDVESLRPHYARTLRHWVRRLETHKEEATQLVQRSVYRIWRLYMAACAVEFEKGGTGVYQILAANRNDCSAAIPWNRWA